MSPGDVEFAEWATPFTDVAVDILDIAYAARAQGDSELVARVQARDNGAVYRLVFPAVAAMRLQDESGLLELWRKTEELGGRPGRTSFRVRHHAWARESVLVFLESEGWSFVIASDDTCLEVVSAAAPAITEWPGEGATAP